MLLGDVVEADHHYTGMHSRDVVELSLSVARELGLDARRTRSVEFAALLHDVGKIHIPKEIINKPGKLDESEWQLMRRHTIDGEQMLERVGGLLATVGHIVRATHEHYDGGGYPDGLAGKAIPIEARIVCTCDAYSAMTTDRSYRKAMSDAAALAELRRCAGSQFDPEVVGAIERLRIPVTARPERQQQPWQVMGAPRLAAESLSAGAR
jgi:putative nucleotidyltransferase with HDIG domain